MRRVPSRPGGNAGQDSRPDGAGAGMAGEGGALGAGLGVPGTWRGLLEELAPVFRRRSTHALFLALACGMILAGRRTVVAMAAAAGMTARFRRACWFFSHAAWDTDDLGVAGGPPRLPAPCPPGGAGARGGDGGAFQKGGEKEGEGPWGEGGGA